MDAKSIRAYARAEVMLMHAIEDAGGHVPEDMFDQCCENPAKGFVELHRLARANDAIAPKVKAFIASALSDVDPEAVEELPIEEQGTYILAWYAADGWQPDTLTVPEAAREANVTPQAIRNAIETDPDKVEPGKILGSKPKNRWLVDRDSFERWKAARDARD